MVEAAAQSYRATFILQPTDAVGAPRNARGHAELKWPGGDEFSFVFRIQTRGLVPGDYAVVGAGTNGLAFTRPITVGIGGQSRDVFVFEAEEFFDPASVASLAVLSNNIPLLSADLQRPGRSTAFLHSTVAINPSDAAPGAAGFATWRRLFRNGRQKDHVTVHATGVANSSPFMLFANGTQVGAVNSNPRGRIAFSRDVPPVAGFGPVQLIDSEGTEALHADF